MGDWQASTLGNLASGKGEGRRASLLSCTALATSLILAGMVLPSAGALAADQFGPDDDGATIVGGDDSQAPIIADVPGGIVIGPLTGEVGGGGNGGSGGSINGTGGGPGDPGVDPGEPGGEGGNAGGFGGTAHGGAGTGGIAALDGVVVDIDGNIANGVEGTLTSGAGTGGNGGIGGQGSAAGAGPGGAGADGAPGGNGGNGGTGTIEVLDGAVVIVAGQGSFGASVIFIGEDPPQLLGHGTLTVDGVGSTVTYTGTLDIGEQATGILNIQNGGFVSNSDGYLGSFTNAVGSAGNGTATITGADSTWQNNGFLRVGDFGTGTMNVLAGGLVTNTSAIIANPPTASAMRR